MARVNREREPGEKENRCLRRLKWNGANERGKFRGKINEPGVSGPRATYTLMATANKRFVLSSVRVCMRAFRGRFPRVN